MTTTIPSVKRAFDKHRQECDFVDFENKFRDILERSKIEPVIIKDLDSKIDSSKYPNFFRWMDMQHVEYNLKTQFCLPPSHGLIVNIRQPLIMDIRITPDIMNILNTKYYSSIEKMIFRKIKCFRSYADDVTDVGMENFKLWLNMQGIKYNEIHCHGIRNGEYELMECVEVILED